MTSQQEKDSSGYSEALCKTSFDFTSFYQNYKFIDPRWLEWFIGFTEGDGAILESKGKLQRIRNSPQLVKTNCIIFTRLGLMDLSLFILFSL